MFAYDEEDNNPFPDSSILQPDTLYPSLDSPQNGHITTERDPNQLISDQIYSHSAVSESHSSSSLSLYNSKHDDLSQDLSYSVWDEGITQGTSSGIADSPEHADSEAARAEDNWDTADMPSPSPDRTNQIVDPSIDPQNNTGPENVHSMAANDSSTDSGPQYLTRTQEILRNWDPKSDFITITQHEKLKDYRQKSYIVYVVPLRELTVKRRYSEFESLCKCLVRLFPTLVIPTIPEKHSVTDYLTSPRHARSNLDIIEYRKRSFASFLNKCLALPELRRSAVMAFFLDPNVSWSEVLNSSIATKLPVSSLFAPPVDPVKNLTPLHSYLPAPTISQLLNYESVCKQLSPYLSADISNRKACKSSHKKMKETIRASEDSVGANEPAEASRVIDNHIFFNVVEGKYRAIEAAAGLSLDRCVRRLNKRHKRLSAEYTDLGAFCNAFSLQEEEYPYARQLAPIIESVGQAYDMASLSTDVLRTAFENNVVNPYYEMHQMLTFNDLGMNSTSLTSSTGSGLDRTLKFRKIRYLQQLILAKAIFEKKARLERLIDELEQAVRIEEALKKFEEMSIHGSEDSRNGRPPDSTESAESAESAQHAEGTEEGTGQETPKILEPNSPLPHNPVEPVREPVAESTTDKHSETRPAEASPGAASDSLVHEVVSIHSNGTTDADYVALESAPAQPRSWWSVFGGNRAGHGAPQQKTVEYRRQEISCLQQEITQYGKVLQLATRESYITDNAVRASVERFEETLRAEHRAVMRSFCKIIKTWAGENLKAWEVTRNQIRSSTVSEVYYFPYEPKRRNI